MLIPRKSHSLVLMGQSRISNETQFEPSTCLLWYAFKVAASHRPMAWTVHLAAIRHPICNH